LYETAPVEKKRRMLKIVTSNLSLEQKTIDFAFKTPFGDVANRKTLLDGGPSSEIARTWETILPRLIELLQMVPVPAD
jgi:hypothetical protein